MASNNLFDNPNASLEDWLSYLETIHSTEIDLGLARITKVAQRLQCHLKNVKVITVAGTNGKGTTCAFLENALLSKGFKVAVYSSPHIHRFNERLRINKAEIDDAPLIAAFNQIEKARKEISLTYYEYTTLAAFIIMQSLALESLLDYAILEVGLGGRLDATNMIDADIGVITSIDLDHQAFLGDTRELIGIEKAGILRTGKPAVVGEKNLPAKVLSHIEQLGCELTLRGQAFDLTTTEQGWLYQFEGRSFEYQKPHIPVDNVATALTVLSKLAIGFEHDEINALIENTKVPGRTQLISTAPDVICDVAHNPHAARHLANFVANYQCQHTSQKPKQVHAVVGMLSDKDIKGTIATMMVQVDHWYVAGLDIPRGASAEQLSQSIQELGIVSTNKSASVNAFDNIEQAYTIATDQAGEGDLVVVFGSFFTVAEIPGVL